MAGNALLTEEEKQRLRYHTGYLVVAPVNSILLGVPAATQPMFLLEQAMEHIPDTAISIVREHIAILDGINAKLVDAQDFMGVERVEGISINDRQADKLDAEYVRWAKRLADVLGIPLNPYSERFRGGGGGPQPLMIPVLRS